MIHWLRRFIKGTPHCRRFRHVDGFLDETDYVQVDNDGASYIVSKSGFARETWGFDLATCLQYVEAGEWIELEIK